MSVSTAGKLSVEGGRELVGGTGGWSGEVPRVEMVQWWAPDWSGKTVGEWWGNKKIKTFLFFLLFFKRTHLFFSLFFARRQYTTCFRKHTNIKNTLSKCDINAVHNQLRSKNTVISKAEHGVCFIHFSNKWCIILIRASLVYVCKVTQAKYEQHWSDVLWPGHL